jgi:acetylornithine deacetylase
LRRGRITARLERAAQATVHRRKPAFLDLRPPEGADSMNSAAVVKRVESRRDELISLAQQLVRTNTVNPYGGDPPEKCGNEAAGQAVIEPLLKGIGAHIEKFDCPADIYKATGVLGPKIRDFRRRPNLVAEINFGAGCQRALLMFHMDTVGVSGMTIPPHSGDIRDGKLYGRGSSDCRVGIAAAIVAARVLHECRDQLRGSLTIFSVVEEECNGGGAGALACVQRFKNKPAPVTGCSSLFNFAICVDGNGPSVTRGFNGVITGELRVRGQGGHAAGAGGVNAIDKAVSVKGALDAFKRERESAQAAARVNLGIFRAGVHPATIPAEALLAFNACTTVADDSAKVRARFEELLRDCQKRDPWLREHPAALEWIKDLAPYETPADHWLVRDLAATHARVLGQAAKVEVNPAWSDACWLSRAGIPTVNYGAGTPGQPHSDGEHAELSRMLDCCKVVTAFLYEQLHVR